MKQQILHTPEGVRDIYSAEYRKKQVLEDKLQRVFRLFGYQDVQTPMLEYFDVFGKEIGQAARYFILVLVAGFVWPMCFKYLNKLKK